MAAVAYAAYRYRAERIAKKKAIEAARKSMITGHIDSVNSNKQKNEKNLKVAASADAERRAAAAAASAAATKAEEDAKAEAARAKERVKSMRSEVWRPLAGEFKVRARVCGSGVLSFTVDGSPLDLQQPLLPKRMYKPASLLSLRSVGVNRFWC